MISIHTTARVVTISRWMTTFLFRNFNPHHRTGGDQVFDLLDHIGNDFNPHHRTGGDLEILRALSNWDDFNPHHRTGGDDAGMLSGLGLV